MDRGQSNAQVILDWNLFLGLFISHDKTDTRRRSDGSPVLYSALEQTDGGGRNRTLSPKPHILARMGCWTTCSDQIRPSWRVETGARWGSADLGVG